MKTRTGFVLGSLLCLSAATVVPAQIRIERHTGGGVWAPLPGSPLPAGSNVTISNAGSDTYRIYTDVPTTQDIGNVWLFASAGDAPTLFIGTGLTVPNEDFPLTAACRHCGWIYYNGGTPRLQVSVNQNVGDIAFWHIFRVDAGFIQQTVTHDPVGAATPPRLGVVRAGAFGSPSDVAAVIAKRGDIRRVQSTGNLYADVICDNGSITGEVLAAGIIGSKNIKALNGSINDIVAGSLFDLGAHYIGSGTGGSIATTIQAKSGIHVVRAEGMPGGNVFIRANITANANNGSGSITRLEATDDGYGFTGHFYGSLTANRALGEPNYYAIYTDRDFNGSVTLKENLEQTIFIGAFFPAGNTISIGQGVGPSAQITVGGWGPGANCMGGQIIVNAVGDGTGTYLWHPSSVVTFCALGNVLSPIPFYTQQSASFGGGAVGEAPFNFHATDCSPAHNSVITISQLPIPVIVRHYGPIYTNGSGSTLKIEARPIGGTTWTDYTSDFSVTLYPGNHLRSVSIVENPVHVLGFAAGFEYRITPITDLSNPNALRCLMVATKPAVRAYEYRFTISP